MPQPPRKGKAAIRNVDRQSGKNRVSRRQPEPEIEPQSEPEYSDSDVESVLSISEKDVSQRKKKQVPKPKNVQRSDPQIHGEESDDDFVETKGKEATGSKIAPHMALILAAGYFLPLMTISESQHSFYVPDCRNLFTISYFVCELLVSNFKVFEICPQFNSVAFNAYLGYTYFYAILKARTQVPGLNRTREERRSLQRLEALVHPAGWPILAPFAGFIKALGYVKISDTRYSYVVPTFPDFSALRGTGTNPAAGFEAFSGVANIQRVPPVPALVQFLYNFGQNAARFTEGYLTPVTGTLSATNSFLKIVSSAANSANFQTLAFASGWIAPAEMEGTATNRINMGRNYWKRKAVPDLNDANFDDIEKFLALDSTKKVTWLSDTLSMVEVITRFFPGSTNLEAIGASTDIGSLTRISVARSTAREPKKDVWYRGRNAENFKYYSYTDTEEGRILTRMGIVTGTNTSYDASVIPVGTTAEYRSGPFFIEGEEVDESRARYEAEGETETDPLSRISEQLASLYNAKGGTE